MLAVGNINLVGLGLGVWILVRRWNAILGFRGRQANLNSISVPPLSASDESTRATPRSGDLELDGACLQLLLAHGEGAYLYPPPPRTIWWVPPISANNVELRRATGFESRLLISCS